MIVNEVLLKILYLIVIEHHLRKLTYAGIDTVHYLMGLDLLFEHRTAFIDTLSCIGMQFNLLTVTGYIYNIIDREA